MATSTDAAARAPGAPDAVCLGETMVALLPAPPAALAAAQSFRPSVGGAESNVACTLAALGHPARWLGRVGADGFGDTVVADLAARGVDVSAVQRDPGRPTGVYFRTSGTPSATDGDGAGPAAEVAYYRAGSAASAMAPTTVRTADADAGRVLHLTGITAALSADCRDLLEGLTGPRRGRPLVSFDANYRPGLWARTAADPQLLLDLARRCDAVFVGEDEAAAAWGLSGGPAAVRAALPEPGTLVVKQGARGATAFGPQAPDGLFCPAVDTPLRSPVGAGDAFAAGFLSAVLRGLPLRDRLRHGHLAAAAAVAAEGDVGDPLDRARADALAALSDADWAALRFPGAPEPPFGAAPAAEGVQQR
ncbi:sugar kinase [Nocardiopsis coralliicola]